MNEKQAIAILKKYSTDEKSFQNILRHVKNVQKLSLKLAMQIIQNSNIAVDLEFIRTAALLHDIGSFKYPPGTDRIRHGLEGGRILRNLGYLRHARLAERHIGAGITKEDIIRQKLDLPKKDFMPKTIEEEIIAYCDNFDYKNKTKGIRWVIRRYEKRVGKYYANRIIRLHNKLERLKGGKKLI